MENIRQSDESDSPSIELIEYAEELLIGGKTLANRLDEVILLKLEVLNGVVDLRYKFRHAPSLISTTTADLFCANIVESVFLFFEVLLYQDEEGALLPFLLLSNNGSVRDGNGQYMSKEYLADRVLEAVSCNGCNEEGIFGEQIVKEILVKLVELLKDQTLSIRTFISTATENGVRIVRDDK